jgi:hypothetical protein
MSVEYTLFIVDWGLLKDRISNSEDIFEAVKGLESVPEERAPFFEAMDFMSSLAGMLAVENRSTQPPKRGFFAKLFGSPEARPNRGVNLHTDLIKLDQVFGTLFWSWTDGRHPQIKELEAPADKTEFVEIALTPASVQRLARVGNDLQLENLSELFAQGGTASPVAMRSFIDFRNFAENWLARLRDAVGSNCGMLVVVYG